MRVLEHVPQGGGHEHSTIASSRTWILLSATGTFLRALLRRESVRFSLEASIASIGEISERDELEMYIFRF